MCPLEKTAVWVEMEAEWLGKLSRSMQRHHWHKYIECRLSLGKFDNDDDDDHEDPIPTIQLTVPV